MLELTPVEQVTETLNIQRGELIALVGGGGKTTTMFAIANALAGTSVISTTTKMGADQHRGHALLISPDDTDLAAALMTHQRVVAWNAVEGTKALGITPETADRWHGIADNVVIEADGARRRAFKAPRPFEPVIPSRTTTLIACIGASALSRVIQDACHRPMRVAAIAECRPGERLTPQRAAAVLLSDRGSRKGLPSGARYAVAICQVKPSEASFAAELAELLTPHVEVVAVSPFD